MKKCDNVNNEAKNKAVECIEIMNGTYEGETKQSTRKKTCEASIFSGLNLD